VPYGRVSQSGGPYLATARKCVSRLAKVRLLGGVAQGVFEFPLLSDCTSRTPLEVSGGSVFEPCPVIHPAGEFDGSVDRLIDAVGLSGFHHSPQICVIARANRRG